MRLLPGRESLPAPPHAAIRVHLLLGRGSFFRRGGSVVAHIVLRSLLRRKHIALAIVMAIIDYPAAALRVVPDQV